MAFLWESRRSSGGFLWALMQSVFEIFLIKELETPSMFARKHGGEESLTGLCRETL